MVSHSIERWVRAREGGVFKERAGEGNYSWRFLIEETCKVEPPGGETSVIGEWGRDNYIASITFDHSVIEDSPCN